MFLCSASTSSEESQLQRVYNSENKLPCLHNLFSKTQKLSFDKDVEISV